jgi:polar amino acid transport system permease protein
MENYLQYVADSAVFILEGSVLTLQLYAVTIIFAIPLGIILALMKISKYKSLRYLLSFYTWVFAEHPFFCSFFSHITGCQ